jgi:ankyrin repeat protein
MDETSILVSSLRTVARRGDVQSVRDHISALPWLLKGDDDYCREVRRDTFVGAADGGQVDVLRLLVALQFEVNSREGGSPALRIACMRGQEAVVPVLLGAGADPNTVEQFKQTPLIAASTWGHLGIVHTLLNHGIHDLDVRADGLTAVQSACLEGYTRVARALLEAGADWTIADGMCRQTPMETAREYGRLGCINLLEVSRTGHAHLCTQLT